MRTQGTKYPAIDRLPKKALAISKYAKEFGISSSAYVHVKYDRHKFGYLNSKEERVFTPHPGYDIVDFQGTCYVINYQS
jgi:hypothetical protein